MQFRSDGFEGSEYQPRDPCSAEPSDGRKRGVIRAVVAEDRKKGDVQVQGDARSYAPNHDRKDGMVDGAYEYDEASKKEEDCDMEQCGQRLDGPGKMELFDAFGEKGADPCALVGAVAGLRDSDISACPLLQGSRK